MCVQMALNPTTCPADGRASVTGLPLADAAIDPRTGIDDTLANAFGGGLDGDVRVGDGRGEDDGGELVAGGGEVFDVGVRAGGCDGSEVCCELVGALEVGARSGACVSWVALCEARVG